MGSSSPGPHGAGVDWSSGRIETELGWALHRVHEGYKDVAEAAVARVPGGPRGYRVLVAITTEAPSSQLALGQRLGIDKNAMTAVVDALEERGLVHRRPDPDDRRLRHVVPTDVGRELLASARATMRNAEEALLTGLSADERTQLRRLLALVALSTERAESCGP